MEERKSGKVSQAKMVSRRSFIKGIAAAGAGGVFLSKGVKTSKAAVSLQLDGQVAVVTGGGRGIGRGIVLTLAKAGADIGIIETDILDTAFNQYRTKEIMGYQASLKVVEEVKTLGRRAMAVQADVSKWNQIKPAVDEIIAKLGKIDIMVNDAGVVCMPPSLLAVEEADWDQTMNVNAKGVFFGCKAVILHMKERNYGRIINVASVAGKRARGGSHYNCSKFVVVALTQAFATSDLLKQNITVNAICPGIVWTQMWVEISKARKNPDETEEQYFARNVKVAIPQGRPQTPEGMGMLALYYATNPDVTGQCWNLDGGIVVEH